MSSAAAGAALSVGLCGLLGQAVDAHLGQHGCGKLAECGGFQAEEGADTVFGNGVQLLQVHASLIGRTDANFIVRSTSLAWLTLKVHARKVGTTLYTAHANLLRDFLRAQLRQPTITAITAYAGA